jgi:hypothetical protein
MEKMAGKTKLSLVQGDITLQETEAIVNTANTTLLENRDSDCFIYAVVIIISKHKLNL